MGYNYLEYNYLGYAILIALVINGALSLIPAFMAKNKGYTFAGFYVVGFFFSWLGIIIIAAILPNRIEEQHILSQRFERELEMERARVTERMQGKQAAAAPAVPVRSSCGAPLKPGKEFCVVCSAKVEGNEVFMPEPVGDDLIRCPKCGSQQRKTRSNCYQCKAQFVELSQRPQQ